MSLKPLWNRASLEAALKTSLPPGPWEATGVSLDTRTLNPGDLFIAFPGTATDGHLFLHEAAQRGAIGALVQRPCSSELPQCVVAPTALADLGRYARQRTQAKILALTGSVGKTSVKEGLKHALITQGPVSGTLRNWNNEIGLPLSLANFDPDAAYGIFELGMSFPGEIHSLTTFLSPSVVMVTTVTASHAENFPSLDAIAQAKAEIFASPAAEIGVLWRDNPFYSFLQGLGAQAGISRWVTYGQHEEANIRLIQALPINVEKLEITIQVYAQPYTYHLPNCGTHWTLNSLAILAGVVALGADLPKAMDQLATFYPLAGRGQRLRLGPDIMVIDETYNAAPAAMQAAIAAFHHVPAKRKIAILGEMRELGPESPAHHLALRDPLLAGDIEAIFACGPAMEPLYASLPTSKQAGYGPTAEDLIPAILGYLQPGDCLLIKGANGMRMNCILQKLFDIYGR